MLPSIFATPARPDQHERAASFRLRTDVFPVMAEGGARLLDLRRGRFYALDPIGAQMLGAALDAGPAETASRLAQDYGVTPECVAADLRNLQNELERRQLIIPYVPLVPARRLPGRLRLFGLLTLAWLCVRVFGWTGTIGLWRRWNRNASAKSPVARVPEAIGAVDQALQAATASHPLNTQCKERALVAWHLLRTYFGLPAELVVGVICYPFQAHVWVEYGPWIVTDQRATCETYTPVARFT
jgi:hypothetical protein